MKYVFYSHFNSLAKLNKKWLGLCFLIFVLQLACNKVETISTGKGITDEKEINKNIVKLAGSNNYHNGVWLADSIIFHINGFGFYTINENFEVINDSIIYYQYGGYFIGKNLSNDKILWVQTRFGGVSVGALREIDLQTGEVTEFLDSTENISSGRYYRNNENIIYYTYGKPFYNNSGYYLYNRITREKKLILSYLAEHYRPEAELVNGFDIHPTENTLLIPAVRMGKSPMIIEYNMDTEMMDTLDIEFDFSFNRICLWLRYNKAGDKILYSCYPEHSGTSTTNDDSEVGIIDMSTLDKRILDVNTNPFGRSVNVFPNWSPNEKDIIYGSGKLVMPSGARGKYHLNIFKNIY